MESARQIDPGAYAKVKGSVRVALLASLAAGCACALSALGEAVTR